jgi:PAS domain S-box-containing protein
VATNNPPLGSADGPVIRGTPKTLVGPVRRAAESALLEQTEQIQQTIDGSRHPIFIKDLRGRFLQINQGFEQMLRLPRDKILGHTNVEIHPPEDAAAYDNLDLQALVVPGGAEGDLSVGQGEDRRTYNVHKFPLRNSGGDIYAILGFAYEITDRKRAEEALRIGEENFRQLAENADEVFWINDLTKNRTVYVSPAYKEIWGRPLESQLQEPLAWLDAVHPDDRERISEAVRSRQTTGEYDEEFRIVRPDGSLRWIHARAFCLRNAQGGVDRLVGVATDITDLKRVQSELSAREEQYRSVFAGVGEGLTVRELDGALIEANPAYCSLLGYTLEELFRLKAEDLFPPESLSLFHTYIETVRKGDCYSFEGQIKRKDGALLRVQIIGTLVHYESRPHVLSTIRDITAQKITEEALRKSEAEFRITFENAPIGIELVAPDGRLMRCNRAMQELLGYSDEEFQGMKFTEFTHPDEVQESLKFFRQLIEGKTERQQVERRLLSKGGHLVRVRITVSLVRGAQNDPQYAITMVEDVTEKRKLEERFLRTQRLENIGTLASGISHDLNNILAPMLMAAGLLKDKLTEPRDQAFVTMIEHGAQRGAAIIRQLLTFSRGVEGEKGNVQIRHLMSEMVDIIRETFPRNIEVDCQAPADLWAVKANATQLHQVLMNLCVNARDAMPKGGRLSLTAENADVTAEQAKSNPQAKPGRYVKVTVADTGEGIPKENVDRIFEPFFTTKGVGQGTGLGLSTVLGIVKNHGGFLTVQSKPSKGSRFEVYLPVAADPQAVSAEASATEPFGHGELVLLVDDEAPVREALQHLLESHKYRVLSAGDGAQALRTFIQHREVQLVLTDMMMPTLDGLQLIRLLRILEPKLRVVAMSGLDSDFSREELEALGVREVVAKPFDGNKLLQSVRRELTAT